MGKIKSTFFLLAAMPLGLLAQEIQQIPNGGFEAWKQHTYTALVSGAPVSYQYYDIDVDGNVTWDKTSPFLSTLNSLNESMGIPYVPGMTDYAVRTAKVDAHSGEYAIKLTSQMLPIGESGIFVPGVVATLKIVMAEATAVLGTPYRDRPDYLNAYVKYLPNKYTPLGSSAEIDDTGAIEVRLSSNGTTIASGKTLIEGKIDNYKLIKTEFNYVAGTDALIPDSITVVFASSSKYDFSSIMGLMTCQGAVGSTLYLDDVSLGKNSSAIKKISTTSVKIYPTITDGILYVDSKEDLNNARMDIYDVTGRITFSQLLQNENLSQINIGNLNKGMYYYRINNKYGTLLTGSIIKR